MFIVTVTERYSRIAVFMSERNTCIIMHPSSIMPSNPNQDPGSMRNFLYKPLWEVCHWTGGDAFEICSRSRFLVFVTSNLGQNISKQHCINNGRIHSESLCLQIVLIGCVTCTANCALFAVQCRKVIKNNLNCSKSLTAGKATVLSSVMESSRKMSYPSAPCKDLRLEM